jgi:hypothetical protein
MSKDTNHANATFSPRAVHEGPRHHAAASLPEPAICEICDALYLQRRWVFASTLHDAERAHSWRDLHRTVCPACRNEREGEPHGFVYVSGEFVGRHHHEVLRLLLREEAMATVESPLARIVELDVVDRDRITVSTSTEGLALRLGKALQEAFGGERHEDIARAGLLARVSWHRD